MAESIKIGIALFVGFGLAFFAMPAPKQIDNCGVYKVDQKSVTAFVLKPPPSPIEHTVCPVAPKCEAQVTKEPDSVSNAEAANVDESKARRHRRRHRVRSYWR